MSRQSWSRRAFLGAAVASTCFALALSLVAGPAQAGRQRVNEIQFMAWSGVNPDTFCIRVVDPSKGNRLEVRQIGNPIPLLKLDVKPEQEREVFGSQQFAQWSFITPGVQGLTAPNGWAVFGQREGQLFRIGLSNGRDTMELGRVQARPDSATNTFAKTNLRTAYWSPDSLRVVVIVTQSNDDGGWSMSIDEAHGFKLAK